MKKWDRGLKPAEFAEHQLVEAILTGEFPVSRNLPGERELSDMLGVTRPTLREVLQRMARDGWVEIQHGKATRVKNYLTEGNLGVLSSIAAHQVAVDPVFIANLLALRRLIAPEYTRLAIENDASCVVETLRRAPTADDDLALIALFDWQVHQTLAIASGNPVFPLLLNSFQDLYQRVGVGYYSVDGAVALSFRFYTELLSATAQGLPWEGSALCESVMMESEQLWHAYMKQFRTVEGGRDDVME
ncbi:MAG: fatty acid metabolism transcriptional regulator FadR [Anaerolineae bacterium]|nr:fatty acid metabolism transcriptional regulator FadR [Anaerolineae bacterium]